MFPYTRKGIMGGWSGMGRMEWDEKDEEGWEGWRRMDDAEVEGGQRDRNYAVSQPAQPVLNRCRSRNLWN